MQRSEPLTSLRGVAVSLALGVAVGCTGIAHAQSNPRQLADANRTAMEHYNNLEIEEAKAGLEKAAKNAERNGIRGPSLARTYSNLAVVLIGGLGDQRGATQQFVKALKEDPNVEPDPIVATPEVMQAFTAAKKSAPTAALSTGEDADMPAPAPRRSSGPAEGNLEHTPAVEQLSQTAVPVYVAKSSDLDIATIKIAYRSTGMAKPRSAEMNETDDGYTFLIPCTDVYEPAVEYFLVAVDDDGETVGNMGSAQNPVSVPIVSARSEEAPSLPGEQPPTQCSADDECPPGMPGCVQHGSGGLGDTCSADSDCGEGMICEDDFCSMGERDGSDDDSRSSTSSLKKKLYFDFGIGIGLTAVGEGRGVDRNPTEADLNPIADEVRDSSGMLDTARAQTLLAARGWDCQTRAVEMEQGTALGAENCAVAVNPGGIVPVAILNVAAGYFVTPKLALALTGRFQIGRGDGPLAGMVLGGRGEYYLTEPADKGFKFGLLAGFGIGQLQARPPPEAGAKRGPFATNGNPGGLGLILNAGARAAYMITPAFGLHLTPTLNFGFPNFLFALDVSAGATVAF